MLNDQKKKFADEYLIDFHGTNAAIRAGYSESRARITASELLASEEIQEYLNERRMQLAAKAKVTPERVLEELTRIALSNPADLYDENGNLLPVHKLPREVSAALASIEVVKGGKKKGQPRYRQHDKVKALELIGKHFMMFKDKIEFEHKGSSVFVFELPNNQRDLAEKAVANTNGNGHASEKGSN